ncbi:CPBP family intramembrane glutamic endopeptidase [Marilutibacter chinensis]|uniref:CPBP family intramembrane metalloprotease n=1 Tax=Marilutibacter chinensis TaxID=2912247 RepID=A0ABS9HVV2_9GAMM|nr:CPBP family intramembrane glutamic endopeptidase [Lysobacter chinensis]MCF7221225.1 CPBP family intramembrane metalloprotease [Lysobacter chinensis]MCF7223034.1 CPBP family intramembrane metalloprotease [Lysobacter chinensis]
MHRRSFVPGRHASVALAVAAIAYAMALLSLSRQPDFSIAEPLFLLGVLGVAFPLLAASLTRSQTAAVPAAAPATRAHGLSAVLVYLAAFAALILGWGFGAINDAFPEEPAQSSVQLLVKLATMVALPLWLFATPRPLPGPFGARRLWLVFAVMGAAYLGLQAVFGRGLAALGELAPAATTLAWAVPLCWLWQTIEAGLAEEVLFRRILQERLAHSTRSPTASVVWASLLFGLAHAPGLWLRGGHLMEGVASATAEWAVAYSIVMIAPAGIVFGVLWARTHSLWLLVPLHGLVDLIPQLAPFIRAWTGG